MLLRVLGESSEEYSIEDKKFGSNEFSAITCSLPYLMMNFDIDYISYHIVKISFYI